MVSYFIQGKEYDVFEIENVEWIVQKIHDGVCQYANASQIAFGSFYSEQLQGFSGNRSDFDMGMEFLGRVNDELRGLICHLHPVHIAAGDLAEAIRNLVEKVQAVDGLDVELNFDIQPDLIPKLLELEAFRIIRELLSNACRHSQSKGILIGLIQDEKTLYIQVEDWGIGFNSDCISQKCCGLVGIRQRVKRLCGTTTITSNLGKGTLIAVELPLKNYGRGPEI